MKFRETYPRGDDAAIREGIPGHAEGQAAIARLARLEPFVAGSQHLVDLEVAGRLVDRASMGEISSAEALAIAREVTADYAAAGALGSGLQSARQQARENLNALESPVTFLSGYSAAFGVLSADLDALEPLSQIATAEAAIASDRGAEHAQLIDLTNAYSDLRSRQLKLLGGLDGVEFPEAAVFADVTSFFKEWKPWRNYGYVVRRVQPAAAGAPVAVPWPVRRPRDTDTRATFLRDCTTVEFLLWARRNGVKLVMPDAAGFRKAQEELATRAAIVEPSDDDGKSEWMDPGAATDGARTHRTPMPSRQDVLT